MDLLLILRDALGSSLVTCLMVAMDASKAGRKVALLVTQDALAALARGSFDWPRELSGQEMRLTIAEQGASMGLPVSGRGEGRQLDAKGLVAQAQQAGVILFACPIWATLLGLEDKLPHGLQPLDSGAVLGLIQDTKQVVGTL